MSFKSFYVNFESKDFFEKKALSKFTYPKQIVRSSVYDNINNNNIYTLDNFVDTTNIINNQKFLMGSSFYSKRFLFKHKHNKNLQMSLFLSFSYLKQKPRALEFYNTLKMFKISKNSIKTMIFLNPIKGGFLAYALGVVGFVPKSQCSVSFKHIYKMYLNKKNTLRVEFSDHELTSFFSKPFLDKIILVCKKVIDLKKNQVVKNFANSKILIDKKLKKREYFSIRTPFSFGGLTIYPRANKKNFSRVVKRKKKIKNFINFVFISQSK